MGPLCLRPLPSSPVDPEATPSVGKLPLRAAFPASPAWDRRKDPAEIGSGTTLLGAASWAKPPREGYFDR